MPLKHRKEVESTELKGVNLAADETKLPFGAFTLLTNWVPALLRALKKKRGVAALDSVSSPMANLIFQDNFLRTFCPTCPGVALGACNCPGAGVITVYNGCGFVVCFGTAASVSALQVAVSGPLVCPVGTVTFTASAGVPPYNWSTTKGILTLNASHTIATLTATANPGSGVSGNAYKLRVVGKIDDGFGCSDQIVVRTHGCADQVTENCASWGIQSPCPFNPLDECGQDVCALAPHKCQNCVGTPGVHCGCIAPIDFHDGLPCDIRTGQMISLNCNPCRISMIGAVVTCTDAVGQSVIVVVTIESLA